MHMHQTEIDQLGRERAFVSRQHDVGRFDVSMNQSGGMRALQRVAQLFCDIQQLLGPECAMFLYVIRQIAAGAIFHRVKQNAVLFAEIVKARDVRMGQVLPRLLLRSKTFASHPWSRAKRSLIIFSATMVSRVAMSGLIGSAESSPAEQEWLAGRVRWISKLPKSRLLFQMFARRLVVAQFDRFKG